MHHCWWVANSDWDIVRSRSIDSPVTLSLTNHRDTQHAKEVKKVTNSFISGTVCVKLYYSCTSLSSYIIGDQRENDDPASDESGSSICQHTKRDGQCNKNHNFIIIKSLTGWIDSSLLFNWLELDLDI